MVCIFIVTSCFILVNIPLCVFVVFTSCLPSRSFLITDYFHLSFTALTCVLLSSLSPVYLILCLPLLSSWFILVFCQCFLLYLVACVFFSWPYLFGFSSLDFDFCIFWIFSCLYLPLPCVWFFPALLDDSLPHIEVSFLHLFVTH